MRARRGKTTKMGTCMSRFGSFNGLCLQPPASFRGHCFCNMAQRGGSFVSPHTAPKKVASTLLPHRSSVSLLQEVSSKKRGGEDHSGSQGRAGGWEAIVWVFPDTGRLGPHWPQSVRPSNLCLIRARLSGHSSPRSGKCLTWGNH